MSTELIPYVVEPVHPHTALSFHFGLRGIGYEEADETWPSDSLFAAMVSEAARLEGLPPRGSDAPRFAQ